MIASFESFRYNCRVYFQLIWLICYFIFAQHIKFFSRNVHVELLPRVSKIIIMIKFVGLLMTVRKQCATILAQSNLVENKSGAGDKPSVVHIQTMLFAYIYIYLFWHSAQFYSKVNIAFSIAYKIWRKQFCLIKWPCGFWNFIWIVLTAAKIPIIITHSSFFHVHNNLWEWIIGNRLDWRRRQTHICVWRKAIFRTDLCIENKLGQPTSARVYGEMNLSIAQTFVISEPIDSLLVNEGIFALFAKQKFLFHSYKLLL